MSDGPCLPAWHVTTSRFPTAIPPTWTQDDCPVALPWGALRGRLMDDTETVVLPASNVLRQWGYGVQMWIPEGNPGAPAHRTSGPIGAAGPEGSRPATDPHRGRRIGAGGGSISVATGVRCPCTARACRPRRILRGRGARCWVENSGGADEDSERIGDSPRITRSDRPTDPVAGCHPRRRDGNRIADRASWCELARVRCGGRRPGDRRGGRYRL